MNLQSKPTGVQRSNLLIMTSGYAEWSKKASFGENRRKRESKRGKGFVQQSKPVPESRSQGQRIRAWYMPMNICVDCDSTSVDYSAEKLAACLWIADSPMPELDMRPGDVAIHALCSKCDRTWAQQDDDDLNLVDSKGRSLGHVDQVEKLELLTTDGELSIREYRRNKRLREWILAAKLKGQSYAEIEI